MATDETQIFPTRAKAAKLAKGNSPALRALRATTILSRVPLALKKLATRFANGVIIQPA
ncbi:MAG TPA: hypothetical protein VF492_08540 [Verrucomicrobiae bacterium]